MTLEDSFLRAILETPDDDLPRLAYADWLEEHDDPRGDFIHLQCRLARMDAEEDHRFELEQRETDLLRLHEDEWLGPIRPMLLYWTFERGFLDTIRVAVAVYLAGSEIPRPATVRTLEVDLTGFEVPQEVRELVPESVARENIVFPLGFRRGLLVLATIANPTDALLMQKLEFILGREVVRVVAPTEQLIEAINRHFPPAINDGAGPAEFTDSVATMGDGTYVESDDALAERVITHIIREAIARSGTEVRLQTQSDRMSVSYRSGGEWTEGDFVPTQLVQGILAGITRIVGFVPEGVGDQLGRIPWTANGRRFDIVVALQVTERITILLRIVPLGS